MGTVIIVLQFEKETERKAVYSEYIGMGWFSGMVYLDKLEVRKMYGGNIPRHITMIVEVNS